MSMSSYLRTTIIFTALFMASMPDYANAGLLPFIDDFEDGVATDGSPVTWVPGVADGTREVISGDYVLSHSGAASSFVEESTTVTDVSIRTQLRFLEANGGAYTGVFARSPTLAHYFGGIFASGDIAIGECDASLTCSIDRVFSGLDPRTSDVLLQFDVIDDLISLTAWSEGATMPDAPQLTLQDDTLSVGSLGLAINGNGNPTTVAFRWLEAVPEPSALTLAAFALYPLSQFRRKRIR